MMDNYLQQQLAQHAFAQNFSNFFKFYNEGQQLKLHQLQKQALKIILKSNKNMLISAPTGAGKTLIFQIAILHSIFDFCKRKSLKPQGQIKQYRAIYTSPTNAVCSQKLNDFNIHFQERRTNMKLKIYNLSSEVEFNEKQKSKILQANIIICTPQMCNKLFKIWLFQQDFVIQLFLVDEIHMIACQKRGFNLQMILNRLMQMQRQFKSALRVVAVSASVPNKNDVRQWLNDAELLQTTERPVPLKLFHSPTYSGSKGDFYQRNFNMQQNLLNIIKRFQIQFQQDAEQLETKRTIENYLIFCPTKQYAKSNCLKFKEQISMYGYNFERPAVHFTLGQAINFMNQYGLQNDQLKACIAKRIAFHHAGLKKNEKQLIVKLFRKGWIVAIFCTSTLSQGVNLPVKAVIIMETVKYVDEQNQQFQYPKRQIDQMLGRAGRRKDDKVGYRYFMGSPDHMKYFANLFESFQSKGGRGSLFELEEIQSNLMDHKFIYDFAFFDSMMNNLDLSLSSNFDVLFSYYEKSLWAIQQRKKSNQTNAKSILRHKLEEVIEMFNKYQLTNCKLKLQVFQRYISIDSYIKLYDSIRCDNYPQIQSQEQFLKLICGLDQFISSYKYNRNEDEKALWCKIQKDSIPYEWKLLKKQEEPNKDKRQKLNTVGKIMFMVQVLLKGDLNMFDTNEQMKQECVQVILHFKSICSLISKITFKSPKFIGNSWQSLHVVFWSAAYNKYCSYSSYDGQPTKLQIVQNWGSHLNIKKCWQTIGIQNNQFGKLNQLVETKDYGFFGIRDVINQMNQLRMKCLKNGVNINLVDKSAQLLKKYQLIATSITNESNFEVRSTKQCTFYVFKVQQERVKYIGQKPTEQKQVIFKNNSSLIVLVFYQQILGMDCIYYIENGRLRQKRYQVKPLLQKRLSKKRIQMVDKNKSLQKFNVNQKKPKY